MKKRSQRKRTSTIFLILGLVFLVIGMSMDQTAFSWIAVVFLSLSLFSGGRWLRRRK